MKISLIAAVALDNAIGKDLDLLWHLPNDFKHFKATTSGHTVIMGRKTYESLPNGALPNRKNIVLSSKNADTFPGCECYDSIEKALKSCQDEAEIFIIGGGEIYRQCLEIADRIYITRVKAHFPEANHHFPSFNEQQWSVVNHVEHPADDRHAYAFDLLTYERKTDVESTKQSRI